MYINILGKSLRFYAIYKSMLCITGIQISTDIILRVYSLYRDRKQRDSVVFKCINISDEYIILRKSLRYYAIYKLMLCITGIQSSTDISLTVYSLYRAIGAARQVLFRN